VTKRYTICLVVMAFCLGNIWAKEDEKKKNRLILSPVMYYSPETSLAFGGAGSYIFRLPGNKKSKIPSSISSIFIYTLKKQFRAATNGALYFKNNDYRAEAELNFEKFPNKFFGIGSGTLETDEEAFTPRNISVQVSVLKKVIKGFYIGLGYKFQDWEIQEVEAGRQLASGEIPGSDRGTISGLIFLLERDTRDQLFFPMKGDLLKFDARFYPQFLGSTYKFNSYTFDLRKYFTLFSSHVFAVQSLVKIQTGNVPFLLMSQMGGLYTMRGYFEGRFRDKNLLVFQAEYRMPLFWRLGIVGFAGFGNVAEKFKQLDLSRLKSAYGFGLRYLFSKKENIYLRMDIGFGQNSSGFYFSIFEAF
jgi:outer membrane protein assembly factor BamA